MLNAMKDRYESEESFEELSTDFGWVEICENKIKEFELFLYHDKSYRKIFSMQRMKTVKIFE